MIGFLARWLFRAVLLVLLVATVAFSLLAFVLNTENGTRWVITRADKALPGSLSVDAFDGTLWRGMQIDTLVYADATQRLELNNVAFDLFWPAIVAGRLTIDDLHARSVHRQSLVPRPDDPQMLQIDMPSLPLAMAVRNAAISRLELEGGEQPLVMRNIVVRGLRADGRRFTADEVRAQRDKVRAQVTALSIRLAGPVETSGDVSWELLESDWSGNGKVSGSLAALRFQQQVSGPYPANVSGELFLIGRVQPGFDAAIRWQTWTFAERPFNNGEIELEGSFDAADARIRADFENDGIDYTLEGTARGNLDALSSFSANISNDLVELDLVGSLVRTPELSATADAVVERLDPQLLNSKLFGELTATAELSIDAAGTLSASRLVAAGDINDIEVQATGEALLAAGRWRCSDCVLHAGTNQVRFDGEQVDGRLTLSAEVEAPDLGLLRPGLPGAVNGNVEIRGNRGDLNVHWAYEDMLLDGSADVLFDDGDVSGSVRSATFSQSRVGDWVLQEPFAFQYADDVLALMQNEWLGALGRLQIEQLSIGGDNLQLRAAIRDVPLELGNDSLPSNYQLSGSASADADLVRTAGVWNGSLRWSQSGTNLRVVEANGDITDLQVRRAEAGATLVDNRVTAQGSIEMDPGVSAGLSITLESLAPDALMSGRLQLGGADWSWIPALVPQIDSFAGTISADIAARGPLNAPTFSGTANWRDGGVAVPAWNVRLKEVGVSVAGASDGHATVEGSARSGSGTLQLSGRLQDLMLPERRASFRVTGKGAELVNWPEYRVWGSPDIQLTGNLDGWHISGQLDVPRAEITPREVPVSAVKVSPDVVVLGEDSTITRETRITGETRLVLGDDVQFEALGLETRLRGNILFRQPANRPVSAEGKLTLVDGSYAMQGQDLEIEQGELVFTGPLDDPLVDVRAVRVIEEFDGTVKAGIRLRGRAQNLTTTVFSEPAMADADALAYLVLGRPLSQASDTEGGELSGAAVALGLRQVTRITDQIGQSIGVDELSLAGDGGETTALVAGKQVNSRLYARYAYGVFSQLGTLLLRYRLNRNLTLEAGAGENQSLDILYTIEK